MKNVWLKLKWWLFQRYTRHLGARVQTPRITMSEDLSQTTDAEDRSANERLRQSVHTLVASGTLDDILKFVHLHAYELSRDPNLCVGMAVAFASAQHTSLAHRWISAAISAGGCPSQIADLLLNGAERSLDAARELLEK